MLAANQATDEQLIAPLCLMQISAYETKFLYPVHDMYYCKTLVIIYWTHLRVNGIWTKSCCPQKTNNRTLFLTEMLSMVTSPYLSFTNDATVNTIAIKLTASTQN